MYEANLKLCLERYTLPVLEAVRTELLQPGPLKGNVYLQVKDGCLELRVESNTVSGLMALVNSYLLLIHASYSALVKSARRSK